MKIFRAILALALINGLLWSLTTPASFARAADTPDTSPSNPTLILKVRAEKPTDVAHLIQTGVDVLEAREGQWLLVQGNATVAEALRAKGFTVEIAQSIKSSAAYAPFTYYGGYRTVAEHEQHMADLASTYPNLAKVLTYGQSWLQQQGQPGGHALKVICITEMQVGDCALNPNTTKARFFLMAAIHARELTTSELAWRWMDLLTQGYGSDADITALLKHTEIWIVPVSNPDGRVRAEEGGDTPLSQRKNLHVASGGSCGDTSVNAGADQDGVDLNRNADFKWGVAGSDNVPCSLVYRGESGSSEPEQQALESLMRGLFHDQRVDDDTTGAPITTTGAMLTLHSYSNLVLIPWGWTECGFSACPPSSQAPNEAGLRAFGFRLSYYNGYDTGQPSELLYAASGTTDDWAYGRLGIAAATFEVGSNYDPCYVISQSPFSPRYTCQDNLYWPLNKDAFLTAAKLARAPYTLSLGPSVVTASVDISRDLNVSPTLSLALTATITAIANDDAFGNSIGSVGRPATQPISQAELYIDTPPWLGGNAIAMQTRDGAFDSNRENLQFTLPLSDVVAGKHLVYVRAQDSSGAWGPTTSAWLDTQPVLVPPPPNLYYFPIVMMP